MHTSMYNPPHHNNKISLLCTLVTTMYDDNDASWVDPNGQVSPISIGTLLLIQQLSWPNQELTGRGGREVKIL
jgi:hypothetical protein